MKKEGISIISGHMVLTAFLIEVAVSLVFLLIFAAGMALLQGGSAFAPLFATLSVSAGAFAASFALARKAEKNGWLYGLATGGITFVLLIVIGLAVGEGGVTLTSLFRFVILLLCALIGGVLGVGKAGNWVTAPSSCSGMPPPRFGTAAFFAAKWIIFPKNGQYLI